MIMELFRAQQACKRCVMELPIVCALFGRLGKNGAVNGERCISGPDLGEARLPAALCPAENTGEHRWMEVRMVPLVAAISM